MSDLQKIIAAAYRLRADFKLRKEELDGVLSFTGDNADPTSYMVRSRASMYAGFTAAITGLIDMLSTYQFQLECPQEAQLLDQVLPPTKTAMQEAQEANDRVWAGLRGGLKNAKPEHLGECAVPMTPEESAAKRQELAEAMENTMPPLRDHPDNKGRSLDLTMPEGPLTLEEIREKHRHE